MMAFSPYNHPLSSMNVYALLYGFAIQADALQGVPGIVLLVGTVFQQQVVHALCLSTLDRQVA